MTARGANGALSGNQFLKFTGALLGCMVGIATLHSLLVVPAIMGQVGESMDRKIEKHGVQPHRDSARREDITLLLKKIDALPNKADISYIREQLGDVKLWMTRLEGR